MYFLCGSAVKYETTHPSEAEQSTHELVNCMGKNPHERKFNKITTLGHILEEN
jgi:hypothetical protein